MTKGTRTLLGRSVFVVEVVLLIVLITLMIGNLPTYRAGRQLDPTDAYINFLVPLMGFAYVSIGVLIVIRAGNVLGWLLCALGLGLTLVQFSDTYTLYTRPSRRDRTAGHARPAGRDRRPALGHELPGE